jgi:hypothetical protein
MRGGRAKTLKLGWMMALLALLSPLAASADDPEPVPQKDQDKKVATDLFDAGVAKMEAGKCDHAPVGDVALCNEARDAFRRAYTLYPAGLGALRNVAYVEKNLGLVGSAARDFRELARQAPLDPNPARRLWAEFAQKEYEALSPRVPHLVIAVGSLPPAKMTIQLDGASLAEPGWGTKLDFDPGRHAVRAEAPQYEVFTTSFELKEGEDKSIDVRLVPSVVAGNPTRAETPAPRSRIAPLIVTAVGGLATGVGLGFGYIAMRDKKEACGDHNLCEPGELESGRSAAATSTVVTSLGLTVLAGGLVWYFLSGDARGPLQSGWLLPYASTESAGIRAARTF